MTERLYYHDSFLYEFEGEVTEVVPAAEINARHGVFLDRTAFYPTSGGQIHDTGWITPAGESSGASRLRVAEVVETEDGRVVHYIEADKAPERGLRIRGVVDVARRHDHMQQHSGQHVLSAAFVKLFNMSTVSFHMGEDACSIDLDTLKLDPGQVEEAEVLANWIVQENRPVEIRYATQEAAQDLGLRKPPRADKEELRLIDIREFDLSACGGTHVTHTGQIGCILLRKTERVRQGWRVEFVCGQRAIATARHDYQALTEAAGLFSGHIWDVPQQVRKSLDDIRAANKDKERLLAQLADLEAAQLLAETVPVNGRKLVQRVYSDRDLGYIRLLAQRLTRREANVTVLLAASTDPASLVFAQSKGMPFDMAELLKETVSKLSGRGGGSKDMAQGGVPAAANLEAALSDATGRLQT
ncbi:MAG TPA: DHHA1 domain-containing protein [Terriglobales bacterium]|nr:DHHA1 domain-containing protein [Terriglobales bacterium]